NLSHRGRRVYCLLRRAGKGAAQGLHNEVGYGDFRSRLEAPETINPSQLFTLATRDPQASITGCTHFALDTRMKSTSDDATGDTAEPVAADIPGPGALDFQRARASGPLVGIKVVDFCSFIAGSYGTMVLGDFGADVIKVEPLTGDLA